MTVWTWGRYPTSPPQGYRMNIHDYKKFRWQEETEKHKQKTGISGYCSCCGAPNMIDVGINHDPECIWYFSDGDEIGSTGWMRIDGDVPCKLG